MIRRARRARKLAKEAERRGHKISFKLAYRICAAANKENIHDYDLFALVEQESGFNAYNGDPTGAYGRHRVEIRSAYRRAVE